MCVSPITLPDTGVQVACRKCRLCIENRVKDWVGRCMAEGRSAVQTHSVTFTYGPKDGRENHEAARILTYSHIQNMLKKLRRDGFPLRYLITGEYGKLKGRAHWHALFFWQGAPPPEIVLDKRVNYEFWPHGTAFFEAPHVQSIRYVCKYINKHQGEEGAMGKLTMSKRPVLGGLYFAELANHYAKLGLAPQSAFYSFPEAKLSTGKPVQFYLSRAAADHYALEFLQAWETHQPGRHIPTSEFIEAYQDRNWYDLYPELRDPTWVPDPEQTKREEFVASHNEHYFGRQMEGFYRPDYWMDPEREVEQWLKDAIDDLTPPTVDGTPIVWSQAEGWHKDMSPNLNPKSPRR